MDRIVHDLMEDQGVGDIMIDLSGAESVHERAKDVVERAQRRAQELGVRLELRVPSGPPAEISELAVEIPTFTPLDN